MASGATTLTALDHLHELRRRLSWTAAFMLAGGVIAYVVRDYIIRYLQQPLQEPLFYSSPTGGFEFVMQVCLLGGCLLALPMAVFQLLRFIEPALGKMLPRVSVGALVAGSCALTAAGAAFGFYVSLPAALHFFNQVGTSNLKPLISASHYFSFVVSYLTVFAAVFQLPLLLLLIDSVHPLDPPRLGRWRKWVVMGSFAVALVLPSAPDPFSQIILALPIIVLYEISLILVRLRHYLIHLKRRPDAHPMTKATPTAPLLKRRPIAAQTLDLRGRNLSDPPRRRFPVAMSSTYVRRPSN